MKKLIPLLTFLFVFASAVNSQTPTPKPAEDNDIVKISTTLIQVDATVTDKNGRVISDLKAEDFEIYENGEKQNITNFSFISNIKDKTLPPSKNEAKNSLPLPPATALRPEQIRRTVALVVDDLSLSFQSTYYVQRALRKFVNEQMQDGDLVAIIRTGAGIGALQQFTSDKRLLLAAIEKVRWNPTGGGKVGALSPIQSPIGLLENTEESEDIKERAAQMEREVNNFRGSVFATGTLGAVNFIVRGMRDLPGRKSIMLFSDGFRVFTRGEDGFPDSSGVLESLRRLVDTANRSSVVIYTMDPRGLQTLGLTAEDDTSGLTTSQVEQNLSDRRAEFFDSQDGLIYLARQTGGFPIVNDNDLSKGIERVLDDQSYYLIGYEPDAEIFDPAKRSFNKLVIKVKRPGARVRYRSGFFGISDEKLDKPGIQTPYQRITDALTSPFAANDILLRLNTIFINDSKQGSFVRSLIHVSAKDLNFTDEPNGNKKTVFDILAVSFGDNGLPVDQISKTYTVTLKPDAYREFVKEGFVYYFTFPVKKPGAYQYRVAVRDSKSEKVGSANQFIEIPNLNKNRLTLSGIVLENLTVEQLQKRIDNAGNASTQDTGTNSMNDTSLRQFKRGTILQYNYEIYNAKLDPSRKPQIATRIRVFRDGKLVLDGKDLPLDTAGQSDLQRIKTLGALNLGTDMETGEYILQIIVTDALAKDKGKLAAQFVQFEIL